MIKTVLKRFGMYGGIFSPMRGELVLILAHWNDRAEAQILFRFLLANKNVTRLGLHNQIIIHLSLTNPVKDKLYKL